MPRVSGGVGLMPWGSRFYKKWSRIITDVSCRVHPNGKWVRESWVFALFVLVVPMVVMIRLIRPVIFIRWGLLYAEKIGHFATNTELWLLERKANKSMNMPMHVDIFYLPVKDRISNQHLAAMWGRSILIVPRLLGLTLRAVEGALFGKEKHHRAIPGPVKHTPGAKIQTERDVHGLLERYPPQLHLTRKDYICGRELLEQMGVRPEDKYVCLIVRDSAYYEAVYGAGGDASLSSLCNADVQDYVPAIEHLTSRGYFVFRMGKHVNSALHLENSKVIDYATSAHRSDFLDIYLGATCEFCVSSGGGFEQIPVVFRKRIAFSNSAPIDPYMSFSPRFVSIFKHYYSRSLGRNLDLSEIVQTSFVGQDDDATLDQKGIILMPNSPSEILDVVAEALACHEGKWVESVADEQRQESFRRIFPADVRCRLFANEEPLHGELRGRVGAKFLENNPGWCR